MSFKTLQDRWLHTSGGLVWHWRAWRHRARWQTFLRTTSAWMHGWQAPRDKLLIVGPSAGYTLDAGFLASWREVHALEPDPLARALLRRRFPRIRWQFDTLDICAPHGFAALAQSYPDSAILFSNLLGQVMPREDLRWQDELRAALGHHHWASYHDVISTTRAPDRPTTNASQDNPSNLEALLERFWSGGEIELVDHASFKLGGEEAAHDWALWELRPGHYHLVEWHAHAAEDSDTHG